MYRMQSANAHRFVIRFQDANGFSSDDDDRFTNVSQTSVGTLNGYSNEINRQGYTCLHSLLLLLQRNRSERCVFL